MVDVTILYIYGQIYVFFLTYTHKNQFALALRWEFWVEHWLCNLFGSVAQFRMLSKMEKHIKRTLLFVYSTTLNLCM